MFSIIMIFVCGCVNAFIPFYLMPPAILTGGVDE